MRSSRILAASLFAVFALLFAVQSAHATFTARTARSSLSGTSPGLAAPHYGP